MNEQLIVAEQLTKRYGRVTVLDNVSFSIRPGESVALWGANGAGKTTALRCLLGLQPFEGRLTVRGIDVQRQGKAVRTLIGYVPQEAAFYDLTVQDTLRFYARLKKTTFDQIPGVLDRIQLSDQIHKPVSALSGGMKQRLALAVALLADPPILVLDEPTANLDVQAQRDFIHTIQHLNQAGKTIVFSSHRLDEVLVLAERVLVLGGGKVQLECAPGELADRLGLNQWMYIQVPETHFDQTQYVLRMQAFNVMPNGRGVYVRVQTGQKIAPLQALERATIPILDFHFVDSNAVPGQGEQS